RQALAGEAVRRDREHQVDIRRSESRLVELRGKAVQLDGEVAAEVEAIRRLEHEVELRVIRAPVSGRVGHVADLPAGSVVAAGQVFGAIVPPGEPRAVALFPAASLGRIRPGQPARLRLDGFPWTQYGTIPATVARVGGEPSGGRIRVELALA